MIRRSTAHDADTDVLLNFVFNYVNRNYNAIKITKYGYVYFSQGSSVTSGNSIVGLNFLADTSDQGSIFYQNLYSPSNAFNRTQSTINRVNSGFVPTNMFRITHLNVPIAYSSSPTVKASFQIILASDSTKSYVVLNYTECLADQAQKTNPGLYYLDQNGQQSSAVIGQNPCRGSNVNLIGVWVFDVTNQNCKQYNFISITLIPFRSYPLQLKSVLCMNPHVAQPKTQKTQSIPKLGNHKTPIYCIQLFPLRHLTREKKRLIN